MVGPTHLVFAGATQTLLGAGAAAASYLARVLMLLHLQGVELPPLEGAAATATGLQQGGTGTGKYTLVEYDKQLWDD